MRIPGSIANGTSLRGTHPASKSIKAMIVDDHQMIREGLRIVLEKDRRVTIVGEAGNGRDAVKLVQELKPNVIIMDVCMPVLNGIEATRRIREDVPDARVLGLSYSHRPHHILEMIRAGAVGYLTKESGSNELIEAICTVASGGAYFSPLVSPALIVGISRSKNGIAPPLSTLTNREREVLRLIAEGKSLKEIAYILKTSGKTAQTHRSNLMQKLNINTVAGLTKFAIRENLISIEEK